VISFSVAGAIFALVATVCMNVVALKSVTCSLTIKRTRTSYGPTLHFVPFHPPTHPHAVSVRGMSELLLESVQLPPFSQLRTLAWHSLMSNSQLDPLMPGMQLHRYVLLAMALLPSQLSMPLPEALLSAYDELVESAHVPVRNGNLGF
jgi:hypothetical protein